MSHSSTANRHRNVHSLWNNGFVELPSTVAGLVIALFALLPGIPAEWCYRRLVGIDWREDKWQRTLRLLGFSTFGLALYAALAPRISAPLPAYILPSALTRLSMNDLTNVSTAFLGHVVGSVVVVGVTAFSAPMLVRILKRRAFVTAWDRFINGGVGHRWVIVALQTGHIYAGYIEVADTSVSASERDVILREPALFLETEKIYRSLEYDSLFILGSSIASIAAVSDPADHRLTTPGQSLFPNAPGKSS